MKFTFLCLEQAIVQETVENGSYMVNRVWGENYVILLVDKDKLIEHFSEYVVSQRQHGHQSNQRALPRTHNVLLLCQNSLLLILLLDEQKMVGVLKVEPGENSCPLEKFESLGMERERVTILNRDISLHNSLCRGVGSCPSFQ